MKFFPKMIFFLEINLIFRQILLKKIFLKISVGKNTAHFVNI